MTDTNKDAIEASQALIDQLRADLDAVSRERDALVAKTSAMRETLQRTARSADAIRGAVESNQVADKDVRGAAILIRDQARAALSAMQPERTAPLVWDDFGGRDGAKAKAFYDASYLITKWSTGKYEVAVSYPGYQAIFDGPQFYDTLELAKEAAQTDYDLRLPAMQPSPAEAAKVLLGNRIAGYGNRKAMTAMWDFVFDQHKRHMLPVSHYDGVLQAGLRALAEGEEA